MKKIVPEYAFSEAQLHTIAKLAEETGLTEDSLKNLTMRYVTLRLKNNEIRQNYYFFAELSNEIEEVSSNEGTLRWFSERELPELEMPYTAKEVIRHYLATGKETGALYGGIATEYGVIFTEMEEF